MSRVAGTAPAGCTNDTAPQQSSLIPWSDLGIDPAVMATMYTPRVFVSTDGENFVEGSFPAMPDSYQLGQIDISAIGSGYVASAQLYDPLGGTSLAKLYTSPDGLTWSESDMPEGQYNSVNVLDDGTIVAFGYESTITPQPRPFTAVSNDGVEWSKVSLGSLIDPTDGSSAQLNVWMSAAGPGGHHRGRGSRRRRGGGGRRIVGRQGRRSPDDDSKPQPGR